MTPKATTIKTLCPACGREECSEREQATALLTENQSLRDSYHALSRVNAALVEALAGLFREDGQCVMVHRYWVDNYNQREADAAIEAAQAALKLAAHGG